MNFDIYLTRWGRVTGYGRNLMRRGSFEVSVKFYQWYMLEHSLTEYRKQPCNYIFHGESI